MGAAALAPSMAPLLCDKIARAPFFLTPPFHLRISALAPSLPPLTSPFCYFLADRLQIDEPVTTVPTIGFNVETLRYKNIKFQVWDLGGQSSIRPYWRCYYPNTDAVIFVVDSTDIERLEVAKAELFALLEVRVACCVVRGWGHGLCRDAGTRPPTVRWCDPA